MAPMMTLLMMAAMAMVGAENCSEGGQIEVEVGVVMVGQWQIAGFSGMRFLYFLYMIQDLCRYYLHFAPTYFFIKIVQGKGETGETDNLLMESGQQTNRWCHLVSMVHEIYWPLVITT